MSRRVPGWFECGLWLRAPITTGWTGIGIRTAAATDGMRAIGLGLPTPALRGSDLTTRAANITLATGTETMVGLTTTITGIADAKNANVTMIAGTTTTIITKTSERLRPVIFE